MPKSFTYIRARKEPNVLDSQTLILITRLTEPLSHFHCFKLLIRKGTLPAAGNHSPVTLNSVIRGVQKYSVLDPNPGEDSVSKTETFPVHLISSLLTFLLSSRQWMGSCDRSGRQTVSRCARSHPDGFHLPRQHQEASSPRWSYQRRTPCVPEPW